MNAGKWMTSSHVTPPLEHQLCRKRLNVVAFDRTEWRPRLLAAMVVSDCLLRAGILNGRCEHVRARLWTAGRPPPRAVQECTRQHAQWSVVLGHTQAHVHSFPVPPDRQLTDSQPCGQLSVVSVVLFTGLETETCSLLRRCSCDACALRTLSLPCTLQTFVFNTP